MKTESKKKKKKKEYLSDLMVNELIKSKKNIDELIMALGGSSTSPLVVRDVLSTGLPNLDRNLAISEFGEWGLPVGRIVSIKSKPNVGKTTLLLRVAEQAFKRGGAVHIIESERALDYAYAKKICPTLERCLISQPDTLEEAFNSVEIAVDICKKARKFGSENSPFVILMDSFSGFKTRAEMEGDFNTAQKALGQHARIASLACRKLTGPLSDAKAILLLSHQTKSKIGVYWGSSDTNIGGDAFNFHDSISLTLVRMQAVKDAKKRICGHLGIMRTTKNKLSPPFREAKFKIINGLGFSASFSVLDFLVENNIVKKKPGGVFIFKEDSDLKWRGMDNFLDFAKTSTKARKIISRELKRK